jgi:hypothetical protein
MNDYQSRIAEAVKSKIDARVQSLRGKYLDLSENWHIVFPDGFRPGENVLPVITANGSSQHLIAELRFTLNNTLDLDIGKVDIVDRDEQYHAERNGDLNDSLDLLNDIVVSLNDFIQGLDKQLTLFPVTSGRSVAVKGKTDVGNTDVIRENLATSSALPQWFKEIADDEIKEKLLEKLADAWLQYQKSTLEPVTLKGFFEKYTEHLKNRGHLYHFCTYKGKPVHLSDQGLCTEAYCSKKPYNNPCSLATLKFGKEV